MSWPNRWVLTPLMVFAFSGVSDAGWMSNLILRKFGPNYVGYARTWWIDIAAVGSGLVVLGAVVYAVIPLIKLLRKGG